MACPLAPNGEKSILWQSIAQFQGEAKADIVWNAIRTQQFLNKTDNWDTLIKDINGEPVLSELPWEIYKQPVKAYQGRTAEDGREFNYFTLDPSEAADYGTSVNAVEINPDNFVVKGTEPYEEAFKVIGKRFDILDNSPEGLALQREYFQYWKSKGYSGYTESENTLKGIIGVDNNYLVTFTPVQAVSNQNFGTSNQESNKEITLTEEQSKAIDDVFKDFVQGKQTFDKELAQKIQDKLQKLYPEIKLNITNDPVWEQGDNIFNQEEYNNQVNYRLKATEILLSDKAKQIFDKGKKANWDLKKILDELQIPKEQKQLILDLDITDREQIALELSTQISYTVEINTAKEKKETPYTLYKKIGDKYVVFNVSDEKLDSFDNKEDAIKKVKEYNYLNTQHYSNLTVPGGTNYTENEIATPAIIPSIKGHAQFATDKGIGWFRSDDKENKVVGWKEEDDFLNSETAQYNPITKDDRVIFGHPTIGKSYLKKNGANDFITLDDDYADEVNTFIDKNRGSETRQEYKGRKPKEYNEFMLNLFDRLKVQAKKEGKRLFVSNTNILKERMSEFDKVITIPKDEFKKRFDARGATYGFEDWKSDIDNTVAKVDKSKVISTTGYLSDLLKGNPKTRRILELQSDIFQKSRDIKSPDEIINELKKSGELQIKCD